MALTVCEKLLKYGDAFSMSSGIYCISKEVHSKKGVNYSEVVSMWRQGFLVKSKKCCQELTRRQLFPPNRDFQQQNSMYNTAQSLLVNVPL